MSMYPPFAAATIAILRSIPGYMKRLIMISKTFGWYVVADSSKKYVCCFFERGFVTESATNCNKPTWSCSTIHCITLGGLRSYSPDDQGRRAKDAGDSRIFHKTQVLLPFLEKSVVCKSQYLRAYAMKE